jgi:hypothetical protein
MRRPHQRGITEDSAEEPGRIDTLEHLRRTASWIALSIFSASFLVLLALSATAYWTPDNPAIQVSNVVLKVSGGTALALSLAPPVLRILRRAWR